MHYSFRCYILYNCDMAAGFKDFILYASCSGERYRAWGQIYQRQATHKKDIRNLFNTAKGAADACAFALFMSYNLWLNCFVVFIGFSIWSNLSCRRWCSNSGVIFPLVQKELKALFFI